MQPLIIPRKEHRISRRQISPNALRALYRLHSNGFIAYLVGGCVRDLLLARSPKDFDIATDARPGQIKRLFRNCRLVGRRFRLAHLHFQNEILEVSTFRRTGASSDNGDTAGTDQNPRRPWHMKDEDGMILMDNVFGTPEEDALRRDFTINALAYNIADFSVIDFTTGLSDLEQGIIRPIGDPGVRFTEDPVRMLRAVRFAASHRLSIEPSAWESLCKLSSIISRAHAARLYEEVAKLFLLGYARPAFSLLRKSGLLAALFPWLHRWIDGDNDRTMLLELHLGSLDRQSESGERPSLPLFLTALLGPGLEEEALACHRKGIPYRRAMDQVFSDVVKDLCETVTIPMKVGNRVRAILDLQASLNRMPKRRPGTIADRPEFPEAMAYLRLSASSGRNDLRPHLDWWDTFLLQGNTADAGGPPGDNAPKKKRRRKRRKYGHGPKTVD